MAERLNKIVTKQGDDGQTRLANGELVKKHDPRICLLGELDELNCHIALITHQLDDDDPITTQLISIQHLLFDIGGEIACHDKNYRVMSDQQINSVEQLIEELNKKLKPLKEFILPGGSPLLSQCHLARAVCRRVERTISLLREQFPEVINPFSAIFLNRLSDLLFVISRIEAKRNGTLEHLWQPNRQQDDS